MFYPFKKFNPRYTKYSEDRSLFLEINLKNNSAKSKDLNFILEMKESSRKMFLSGEWDATAKLLENENLIEKNLIVYLI